MQEDTVIFRREILIDFIYSLQFSGSMFLYSMCTVMGHLHSFSFFLISCQIAKGTDGILYTRKSLTHIGRETIPKAKENTLEEL